MIDTNNPDPSDGPFLRVAKEWRKLDGSKFEPPVPRIEGKTEGYGCDTGCTVYVIYLVTEEDEKEVCSEFIRSTAVDRAALEGDKLGIPVLLTHDWDR